MCCLSAGGQNVTLFGNDFLWPAPTKNELLIFWRNILFLNVFVNLQMQLSMVSSIFIKGGNLDMDKHAQGENRKAMWRWRPKWEASTRSLQSFSLHWQKWGEWHEQVPPPKLADYSANDTLLVDLWHPNLWDHRVKATQLVVVCYGFPSKQMQSWWDMIHHNFASPAPSLLWHLLSLSTWTSHGPLT